MERGGSGLVGNVIQVELRVGLIVDCWGNDLLAQGADGDSGLDGRGGTEAMSQRALDRTDGQSPRRSTVKILKDLGFHLVVEDRAGAVGIVIVDGCRCQSAALQRGGETMNN